MLAAAPLAVSGGAADLDDFDEDDDASRSSALNSRGSWSSARVWTCALKMISVVGLFVGYDFLKEFHVVPGLFIASAVSSLVICLTQKPFSSGPALSARQWSLVIRASFLSVAMNVAFYYGLTLCGPLRTILVSEHSNSAVTLGLASLFYTTDADKKARQRRSRGGFAFLLAVMSLLLLDHDDNSPHHRAYHAEHASQHGELYSLFTHLTSWTDISDHKGGVLLLLVLLLLRSGVGGYTARAAVGVGGQRRLNALVAVVSTVMLAPWALYHGTDLRRILGQFGSVCSVLFVAFSVNITAFYLHSRSSKRRLDRDVLYRIGSLTSFLAALILSYFWVRSVSFAPAYDGANVVNVVYIADHQLSPGVICAVALFCFAVYNLTGISDWQTSTRGIFVGYSAAGLPLYNVSSEYLHEAGQSIARMSKDILKQIVTNSDSRLLFFFLLLNLGFAIIELLYGVWSNSLSLITDFFHMIFDCLSLILGLGAAVITRYRPTRTFSYGFERLGVLSGFVNALFLVVIAFNVLREGISRIFDPPHVLTDKLLLVSVAGLCVNLVGVLAFGHAHSHSHGDGGSHGHSHSANMQGVFLHIMADALGSVGVIVSSFLIDRYGWFVADPICSIFIAVTIFASVVPLLCQSAQTLVLYTPRDTRESVSACLAHLPDRVAGVTGVRKAYVWPHTDSDFHANLTVKIGQEADSCAVTELVCQILFEAGVKYPVVQVERDGHILRASPNFGGNAIVNGFVAGAPTFIKIQ